MAVAEAGETITRTLAISGLLDCMFKMQDVQKGLEEAQGIGQGFELTMVPTLN